MQARVQARVAAQLDSGVAIPSQRAAFRELLRGRAVYDTEPGGHNLASFSSVAQVSLPDSLDGAPTVHEVVGPVASQFLEQNYERTMRPHSEFRSDRCRLHPSARIGILCSPAVGDFLRLLRALHRLGLVAILPASRAREKAGTFFCCTNRKDQQSPH